MEGSLPLPLTVVTITESPAVEPNVLVTFVVQPKIATSLFDWQGGTLGVPV